MNLLGMIFSMCGLMLKVGRAVSFPIFLPDSGSLGFRMKQGRH